MGIESVKWRCPKCNIDVGGSMGELKNHMKKAHNAESESRIATA